MFKSIKNAYNAGWRAGMTDMVLIYQSDGTKVISEPANPFKHWYQFMLADAWNAGKRKGVLDSIRNYLKGKAQWKVVI